MGGFIYINMENEIEKRLNVIKIENIAFLIFIILIILAYYANEREVDYFLENNHKAKCEYYYLQIIIFLVTTIVSGYYAYLGYLDLINLRDDESEKKREYTYLSFIASGAALIAAVIFLYIAITDTEIEAEISL